MDKYQKYILNRHITDLFIFCRNDPMDRSKEYAIAKCGKFNEQTDSFCINQDDDITKTKYTLAINPKEFDRRIFSGIYISKDGQWTEVPCVQGGYSIVADFDDRINEIKFSFLNGLADDYVLKIVYIEADKEKYYAAVAQQKKEALEKAANIKVATGTSLVNIYFNLCCKECERTEITLYIPDKYRTVGGPHGPVQEPESWTMFKKCELNSNDLFLSVQGLAYGTYSFVLRQFDKNNQEILCTDHITFNILEPVQDSLRFGPRVNFI